MRERGSILVGVLWCMVLLSLLVIGVLHTSRMDLLVQKNYGDRVQAHYLALAGVERAKALLFQDVVKRQQTAKNHTGDLYNDQKNFGGVSLGRGTYQIFCRAPQEEGGDIVYGISDEESRLNINIASPSELTNLPGMTVEILGDILAWRGAAPQNAAGPNDAPQGGANSDYYLSLQPPYAARNGPFQTVRELLMVRGVTFDLLLGNDDNQNGFLDSDDDPLDRNPLASRPSPPPTPGWASFLTVTDTDKNVNASGHDRVNPQTADETTLAAVPGLTQPIAHAIVAYRSKNQLHNLDDLLSVTAPSPPGQNPNGNATNDTGPTVISQDLFGQIADDLSLASGADVPGLININTAGLRVLMCLPGVERPLAQAIINYRKTTGYFDNVAGLLRVDGMTRAIFKQVVPLITARSETFRITCEGKITSSGARQRIEAIVHIDRNDVETLGYREDL